jgi:hypothetical protein
VPLLRSTWEPSDLERRAIALGQNVELIVFGTGHPPVAMRAVDTPLGRSPTRGLHRNPNSP